MLHSNVNYALAQRLYVHCTVYKGPLSIEFICRPQKSCETIPVKGQCYCNKFVPESNILLLLILI